MSYFLTQDLLKEHVDRRLPERQRSGWRRSARLILLEIRRLQRPITDEAPEVVQAPAERGKSTSLVLSHQAAFTLGEANPAQPSV